MASWFALVQLALTSIACLDQGHRDDAEAARRDARIAALEREHALLAQHVALMTGVTNSALARSSSKEDERDRRIAELSAQIASMSHLLTTWREEERPPPIEATTPKGSAERAAAVRTVQALLDAGQVKLTVRNGRSQLALLRPIDATNPYQPRGAKPAPGIPTTPAPKPKRPLDSFGF